MNHFSRFILSVSLFASAPTALMAQEKVALYKIVTATDEIIIGLNEAEAKVLGGSSAGAVARGLADRGELTVWMYAVRKAQNGDLEYAPLRQIGLLGSTTKRVEPYTTPLGVSPHR